MSRNQVKSFAPASIGNVGPGFDVFGLALKGLGDHVVMTRTSEPGVKILGIEGDLGRLPLEADKNTAGLAARNVLNLCKRKGDTFGVELILKKDYQLILDLVQVVHRRRQLQEQFPN